MQDWDGKKLECQCINRELCKILSNESYGKKNTICSKHTQEKNVPALQRYSGGIPVELWYYTGNQPEQMGPLEFHWESTGILVNLDKLFVQHWGQLYILSG